MTRTTGTSPTPSGTYGGRQSMPADLKAQFKALLDQGCCRGRSRCPYRESTRTSTSCTTTRLPGIPIVLATGHGFRAELGRRAASSTRSSRASTIATISKTAGAKNPTTFTDMPPSVMQTPSIRRSGL